MYVICREFCIVYYARHDVLDGQDVCSNEAALVGLREAALRVAKSLDDLMNHIRRGTTSAYEGTQVIFVLLLFLVFRNNCILTRMFW